MASDNSAGNSSWSSDQQIFQLVVDNNIEVVRKMLDSDNSIVNKIDDKGNPSLTHSLTHSLTSGYSLDMLNRYDIVTLCGG